MASLTSAAAPSGAPKFHVDLDLSGEDESPLSASALNVSTNYSSASFGASLIQPRRDGNAIGMSTPQRLVVGATAIQSAIESNLRLQRAADEFLAEAMASSASVSNGRHVAPIAASVSLPGSAKVGAPPPVVPDASGSPSRAVRGSPSASGAAPISATETFSWLPSYFERLTKSARSGWVDLPSALSFLHNGAQRAVNIIYDAVGLVGPPSRPEAGSLFIVDETRLANWREDGYLSLATAAGSTVALASLRGSGSLSFVMPATASPTMAPAATTNASAAAAMSPGTEASLHLEWVLLDSDGRSSSSSSGYAPLQRRALRLPRQLMPSSSYSSSALRGAAAAAAAAAKEPGWIWLVQYFCDSNPPAYDAHGAPVASSGNSSTASILASSMLNTSTIGRDGSASLNTSVSSLALTPQRPGRSPHATPGGNVSSSLNMTAASAVASAPAPAIASPLPAARPPFRALAALASPQPAALPQQQVSAAFATSADAASATSTGAGAASSTSAFGRSGVSSYLSSSSSSPSLPASATSAVPYPATSAAARAMSLLPPSSAATSLGSSSGTGLRASFYSSTGLGSSSIATVNSRPTADVSGGSFADVITSGISAALALAGIDEEARVRGQLLRQSLASSSSSVSTRPPSSAPAPLSVHMPPSAPGNSGSSSDAPASATSAGSGGSAGSSATGPKRGIASFYHSSLTPTNISTATAQAAEAADEEEEEHDDLKLDEQQGLQEQRDQDNQNYDEELMDALGGGNEEEADEQHRRQEQERHDDGVEQEQEQELHEDAEDATADTEQENEAVEEGAQLSQHAGRGSSLAFLSPAPPPPPLPPALTSNATSAAPRFSAAAVMSPTSPASPPLQRSDSTGTVDATPPPPSPSAGKRPTPSQSPQSRFDRAVTGYLFQQTVGPSADVHYDEEEEEEGVQDDDDADYQQQGEAEADSLEEDFGHALAAVNLQSAHHDGSSPTSDDSHRRPTEEGAAADVTLAAIHVPLGQREPV